MPFQTLADMLERRSSQLESKRAFTWLSDGEREERTLTYGELDQRARAIASKLKVPPGERVLLLYAPGLDFIEGFFGCLYAGVVAVPAYPPDPMRLARTLPRLQAIAKDAQATTVLTTAALAQMSAFLFAQAPELGLLRWVASDEAPASDWAIPPLDGDALAFLQYTSGSTGTPKGVMLSHGNLVHNEAMIESGFETDAQSVVVGWLPQYHDMGLIGNVLQPLWVGGSCVLMSPLDFLSKPMRWLRAISTHRGTTSGGPNFAYDLCVRKSTPDERAALDLASWSVAFTGAEPVRAETLERFVEAFAPAGFSGSSFYPCYGLAEASLIVSGGRRADAPIVAPIDANGLALGDARDDSSGQRFVSCGRALLDEEIVIVDPAARTRCGEARVGEVWVRSASVARGYFGRAELSAETFGAKLCTGEGPFLRTGDLGFFREGELFVSGRLKDLIIIRGRNVYPQDVELTVEESHPALRPGCGAAFSVERDGEERLVVVQEVDRRAKPAQLDDAIVTIREAVSAAHGVQIDAVVLLPAGAIAKTTSGKIQRHASKAQYLERTLAPLREWESGSEAPVVVVEAVASPLVSQLGKLVAEALGVEAVDPRRSLASYGVDSLGAVELQSALRARLGKDVSLGALIEVASLERLAELVDASPAVTPTFSEPVDRPLSLGQGALLLAHDLEPDRIAHHIALALRFDGRVDARSIEQALRRLIARHEALRATIDENDGVSSWHVHGDVPDGWWRTERVAAREVDARVAAIARERFDLRRHAPLRAVFLEEASVLVLVLHHIAADLWSLALFAQQLGEALLVEQKGGVLPSTHSSKLELGTVEAMQLATPAGQAQLAAWVERLAGELPTLALPTDRPRPRRALGKSAALRFELDEPTTAALRALGVRLEASLVAVLLSAEAVLLSRLSGQREVIIGVPTNNRGRSERAGLIGYFVNTLPLRVSVDLAQPFEALVGHVRDRLVELVSRQETPLPAIVETLASRGDGPPFNTTFTFQRMPRTFSTDFARIATGGEARIDLGGTLARAALITERDAQVDTAWVFAEVGGRLLGSLEYAVELFDDDSARALVERLQRLVVALVAKAGHPVGEAPLASEAERHRQLVEWNDTAVEYEPALLHELVEAQVVRTPDAEAVRFEGTSLSYRELDERANRLAGWLQKRGVGPDVLVGLCVERSLEMMVGLLGILKAGGAYVPLDPENPTERLVGMLEDAGARIVLTQARHRERLGRYDGEVVALDVEMPVGERVKVAQERNSLAYVIYTSGSTGKPKGAMNEHAGVVNRLTWMEKKYGRREKEVVLQKTPYTFDVSVWELFWPLMSGAKLVVGRPGGHREPSYLAEVIERAEVTTVHFVPSMLASFLEEESLASRCKSVRQVMCSGEALPADLAQRAFSRMPSHIELHNLYGPTEAAVEVTYHECERGTRRTTIPIGRPLANVQMYVLDEAMRPVPVGVQGELYIGGVQVGRGYLARPELTAEKFVPSPFKPGERLYRTGDLGRWTGKGELEYTGRTDHQVKIRGFRIELGEIESALVAVTGVREAAVVVRGHGEHKRLVGYVTGDVDASLVKATLRKTLPEYMVPATIVNLAVMPLSTSGKVDRKALPDPEMEAAKYVAPRDERERVVAAVWSEVLRVERVGATDDFFALGGHSLLALRVVAVLRGRLGLPVEVRDLFEAPTVEALAARLDSGGAASAEEPLRRVAREGLHPLTATQEQLWLRHELDPRSNAWNMATTMRLEGALEVESLKRVMSALVERHEPLRTRFVSGVGGPSAEVGDGASFALTCSDLSAMAGEEQGLQLEVLRAENRLPFDLETGPVLRARLVRLSETSHELIFAKHHIAGDGQSGRILLKDLQKLYTAQVEKREAVLGALPIQQIDVAHWERARARGRREGDVKYWQRQLEGAAPVLALPVDRSAPVEATHAAAYHVQRMPSELGAFAAAQGVTPHMLFLSAFDVVLGRWARVEDVLVGTALSSRGRIELENILGAFASTPRLRVDLSGDPSFTELLTRVRGVCLDAMSHQEVPREALVRAGIEVGGDFNVCYLTQDERTVETLRLPGLALTFEGQGAVEVKTAFDLVLEVTPVRGTFEAVWRYRAELFDAETIEGLAARFEAILKDAQRDPSTRLSGLGQLEPKAQQRALERGNRDTKPFEKDFLIHEAFERQVDRAPRAIAVVFGEARLTYLELEERANVLANVLVEAGVGPDVLVGVCLERSLEMVVALLAILKAGGGYVPIDPAYPEDRIAYTLGDANVKVLLTQRELASRVATHAGKTIFVDEQVTGSTARPRARTTAKNTAYVIYTSGSTGLPKGAVIPHENVARLLTATKGWFEFGPSDVWTVFHSYAFDFSVWELWAPLMTGGRAVVVSSDTARAPHELWRLVEREGVTVLNQTPSSFRQLIAAEPAGKTSLRYVVFGGEALEPRSLLPWVARHGVESPRLVNMYGITETTVHVTYRVVDERFLSENASFIGEPIPDLELYVLDERMQASADDFPGELYVGGAGLARGYHGKPELTASRFVPNPYGPPGSRLYRTGDLARRRHGGELEYLGRIDQQVKIRGYRIELGEIERVLGRESGVDAVVVQVREDVSGDKRLVAYVVAKSEEEERLREAARRALPAYMMPSAYVFIDALPLTQNGKLNVRALPAPSQSGAARQYVAPTTEHERWIAGLCAKLLGIERIGLSDNFFELGGHSLLLTQLASHIEADYDVQVPLRALFDARTIADMALMVVRYQLEEASADLDTASMLEELKGLSPEELAALLREPEDTLGPQE